MTEQEIRRLFSIAGKVVEVILLTDKQSHTFNGMGFITMQTETAAQAAMQRLNGTQVGDREVLVEKSIEDPHRQLIEKIATLLGETRKSPINQIKRIVHSAGLDFAEAILQDTLAIEAQGGLLQADGKRRTPSNVFFYLTRQALPSEKVTETFPPLDVPKKHRKLTNSRKQPAVPGTKPPIKPK